MTEQKQNINRSIKEVLWAVVILLLWANFVLAHQSPQNTQPTGCQALRTQILRDQCEAQVHPPIGHPK